jgi:hypothetical protein
VPSRNYWKAKYRGSVCIPGGHTINGGTLICVWGDRTNKRYACKRCAEKHDKKQKVEKKKQDPQGSLF